MRLMTLDLLWKSLYAITSNKAAGLDEVDVNTEKKTFDPDQLGFVSIGC